LGNYRSEFFYHSPNQKKLLNARFRGLRFFVLRKFYEIKSPGSRFLEPWRNGGKAQTALLFLFFNSSFFIILEKLRGRVGALFCFNLKYANIILLSFMGIFLKISSGKIIFALIAAILLGGFFAAGNVLASSAPVLTLNGEIKMIMASGSSYNDPGAQCLDDSGNQLPVAISGNVDTLTTGDYTINYDCQDGRGNQAGRISRTVTVSVKPASAARPCFSQRACVKVVFGEWRDCVNGRRSRYIISLDNVDCCFTQEQAAGEQEDCSSTIAVLGVKLYPAGSLLRVPSHKIYVVISTDTAKYISDLKELGKYRGREIFNVSDETLARYRQVLGAKIYADGALLRGPDKKIYVIVLGKKYYISSLKELAGYKNSKINNVSAEVINSY
jgi:hypothetical protein